MANNNGHAGFRSKGKARVSPGTGHPTRESLIQIPAHHISMSRNISNDR